MTAITSHSITARLNGELELTPSSAVVTMDDSWSPYAQATLVCPITDTAQLAALDPRTVQTVDIVIDQSYGRLGRIRDLSRRFGGGTLASVSAAFAGTIADVSRSLFWHWTNPGTEYVPPTRRTLTLGLRARDIDHAAGTVTLTLASGEALLYDNAHLATGVLFVPAGTIFDAVNYVLARVGGSIGYSNGLGAYGPFVPADNPWKPGVSAWDWVAPVVQAAGLRLWCDQIGVWCLTETQRAPFTGGTLALTPSGPERSITQGVDRINRDAEYYTAVIVTYEWTNAEGEQKTAYDLARLDNTAGGDNEANQRVYAVTRDRPYPGPGAAKRILSNLRGRGRVIGVTAVSDYAAEPGRPATVELPSTPLQSGIVGAVSWRFPDDEMDVRLREAMDAGGIETEYTPIPAPEEEL